MVKLSLPELKAKANEVRRTLIPALVEAGSGHSGGPLSQVDILTVLYWERMKHDPQNPKWEGRDYFFLSKGHACPSLYVVLALCGYFPKEWLMTLRKLGTKLQGHPHRLDTPGLESSAGSLGQGLSLSVGAALGLRLDKKSNRVFCLMSDGEHQEGQTWEAIMCAGHYKLDNLCGIVDDNRLQIDGPVEEVMGVELLAEKYRSFRWHVIEVDGHDIETIIKALDEAGRTRGKPTVIVAHTIKGKGVSFMENQVDWHGKPPNKEEGERALAELEKEREAL